VYSVIVPLPSVVVVVVVVSETCAQANGAISASARLSNFFSFYCFLFFVLAGTVTANEILSTPQASPALLQEVIGHTLLFGSQQEGNVTVSASVDLVCPVSSFSKPE
jgi:hypothetical protein